MNQTFFEYASLHRFALFPLQTGTKDPRYGFKWADKPEEGHISEASADPAQWSTWRSEGDNLAIYAGGSRLIVVDIDVKELGRDRAWVLWRKWCDDRHLNAADYLPQVNTASNGWHIFFKIDSNDALSQRHLVRRTEGSKKAIVETRLANGYVVAPESNVDGAGTWTLISNAAPYSAPQALIDACSKAPATEVKSFEAHDGDGSFDFQGISDDCDVIAKFDGLSEEKTWGECVWAIRDYFGDRGYPLAEKISYCDDKDRLPSVWNRAPNKSVKPTTCATIKSIANKLRRDHMFEGADLSGLPSVAASTAPSLPIFCAASLEGVAIPPRRWHVREWIPAETVTLLYGDGGVGKSLIALQLLASTALGRPWFGRAVERGSCLFVTAEDSRDEVHRRVNDIARENGFPLSALTELHIVSLAGEDAILAAPDGRSSILLTTALFTALEAQFIALRPKLAVLDTLADLFGGNEIDRSQARQFIGLLRGLALKYNTTILLLAHPSVSGMTRGTGSSGSTGWNNSVRSRLYFDRIRADDNTEPDPDARVLRSMKSNYGRVGEEIVLHWRRGIFVPEQVSVGGLMAAQDASRRADEAFLKLLMLYEAEGRGAVSPNPGSNYAPKIFADHAQAQGFKPRALKFAMDRLLAMKRIETIMTGPPSRMRQHLIVSNRNYPLTDGSTNALPTRYQRPYQRPTNGLPTPPETLPTALPTACYPNPHHTPVSLRVP